MSWADRREWSKPKVALSLFGILIRQPRRSLSLAAEVHAELIEQEDRICMGLLDRAAGIYRNPAPPMTLFEDTAPFDQQWIGAHLIGERLP